MTSKYANYQDQYYSLPEGQREIEKFFHNKEALELNVALDKQLQLRDTIKSNSEIVEDILVQKEYIPPPSMPTEWNTNAILIQRYYVLCEVIVNNKNWWKKNKNKIELLPDGIFFSEGGMTMELQDTGLQDWASYISNPKTITVEQLRIVGEFIESVGEGYSDDLIDFFGLQRTAPYWTSSERQENNDHAWYYSFGTQFYGNVEKKSIFLHTRYIK